MFDNCWQSENALFPMLMILWGIEIPVKLWHFSNIRFPIRVILSGSVTEDNFSQPAKTSSPMLTALFGMMILLKFLHPANAASPIFLTLFGIVTFSRLLHPSNALSPILVTLDGITIFLRLWHPAKAFCSILVIPSRITTSETFLSTALISAVPFILYPRFLAAAAGITKLRTITRNTAAVTAEIINLRFFCCARNISCFTFRSPHSMRTVWDVILIFSASWSDGSAQADNAFSASMQFCIFLQSSVLLFSCCSIFKWSLSKFSRDTAFFRIFWIRSSFSFFWRSFSFSWRSISSWAAVTFFNSAFSFSSANFSASMKFRFSLISGIAANIVLFVNSNSTSIRLKYPQPFSGSWSRKRCKQE